MEKLWTCNSHITLSLLFFLSLQFLSLAYILPVKYFINCGSGTDIQNGTGRTFIGDVNSGTFRFTSNGSSEVNGLTNSQSLYDSARIFRQPSFYEFDIDQTDIYIVRLHFYHVSSSIDLSTAFFDVSASGFFLVQNFNDINIRNESSLIKEFFLRLNSGKVRIFFLPKTSSSIAYVNAIEVFPVPPDFIPAKAPLIRSTGKNDSSDILPSMVLHTIYRINVGGREIGSDEDKLWRQWDEDDGYLVNRSSAIDSNFYDKKPNYKDEIDEYFAPDYVYQIAKKMNKSSNSNEFFNITWSFSVRKDARHFLRVHFYDIVGVSVNGVLFFDLYIGNRFSRKIDPDDFNNGYTAPFHYDFLVDSDESGFVNVSVGPLIDSMQNDAYLNGLEIMEAMEDHSKDPDITLSESEENKSRVPLVIGSAVGGFGFVCVLASVIWFGLKCRKPKTVEGSEWSPMPAVFGGGSTHSRLTERTITGSPVPHLNLGLKFSLAEIQVATNNFHKKFFLGEGGFGKVYRGILRSDMKVAVKRGQPGAGQGFSEFEREIMVLSRIRHRHLVSLIGYCDEKSEMILVYEFMEKGTLREHLYNSKLPPLSWKKRLEICIGAARGIHYLHKGSAGGIIHRDIKSTNILLDANLVAKVADFGLSRAGSLDETHVSTDVKGTFGYLDPEYFRTQQLTEKSDVYSFGVLLLEVLCARPALNSFLPREQINLAEWGLKCKKMNLLEEIIDPKLEGQIDPNSLRKFSDTMEKCLQEDATDRPAIGDVLWDLEYALQLQQSTQSRMPHEDSATNANGNSSVAIQRFPSIGSSIAREDYYISRNDHGSDLTKSQVFSQMKADEGR